MTENFPNLMREEATQVQEAKRVLIKKNTNRLTARHIIIKIAKFKDKERILKVTREKQEVTYKGTSIRLAALLLNRNITSQMGMARNIPSN